MKPTFKNTTDWEKADILMQPAFIRVMDNLRKELEKTNLVATYEDIQEPFPGYQLILTKENDSVSISIWEICFQVCFTDYQFSSNNSSQASIMVEIDENLFNGDNEINWQQLEIKTQQTIQTIINNFPKI
ncbi:MULTISPECIES: hypothetical protein [Crocosphaera]|uniref:Uncharacterized protein n=4 Tax=Crocosphaera watsonii TaxID=263511 RepID=T2JTI4_CROWT|nr:MULTISPECIES: hypothetical protein [Crocosphaera]EHJ12690.1 hypothetical protein CWATWH0003_2616 [Crocosphaera watsonii WH 0003]MCH2243961.1 hypothetical protein [Crocosphaera sp.]NQZ62969.1 hypothetical protein [Crocosphaera sp.]CCQ69158.1 hypothetical protein CWATWH0402_4722 [Crocosphaera watsonii WH 0402]